MRLTLCNMCGKEHDIYQPDPCHVPLPDEIWYGNAGGIVHTRVRLRGEGKDRWISVATRDVAGKWSRVRPRNSFYAAVYVDAIENAFKALLRAGRVV